MHADVRALIAAGNVAAPLADVNPFAFALPIAPELAARAAGATIDLDRIAAAYSRLAATADAIVVEGAGGALVPLGRSPDMLDIPVRLALPVLLVVGIRLGCLNHALLSALAISARGLRLAGWVANRIDAEMTAKAMRTSRRLSTACPRRFARISRGARTDVQAFTVDRAALRELGFDLPPMRVAGAIVPAGAWPVYWSVLTSRAFFGNCAHAIEGRMTCTKFKARFRLLPLGAGTGARSAPARRSPCRIGTCSRP